jgi:hypothetical protein
MANEHPFQMLFETLGRLPASHAESVNRRAYEVLYDILSVPVEKPGRCILLRAPRAGHGKTHLLSRVQHHLGASHEFIPLHAAFGCQIDATTVIDDALRRLLRPLPASGGLCVLDLVARRLFALALQPLVASGEVPCQDREGALNALRSRPIETFDFHHPNAVTAHWARENFEVLGQRLSVELAQRCGLPIREVAFWVDVLFRFAATPVENPVRLRSLADAIHGTNPGEGILMERLEALLGLCAQLMRVVLVADDLEGFSADESAALRLAAFLGALRQSVERLDVILSLNQDIWQSAFVPRLSGGLADRLSEIVVELQPLTEEEMVALLESRVPGLGSRVLARVDRQAAGGHARGLIQAAGTAWLRASAMDARQAPPALSPASIPEPRYDAATHVPIHAPETIAGTAFAPSSQAPVATTVAPEPAVAVAPPVTSPATVVPGPAAPMSPAIAAAIAAASAEIEENAAGSQPQASSIDLGASTPPPAVISDHEDPPAPPAPSMAHPEAPSSPPADESPVTGPSPSEAANQDAGKSEVGSPAAAAEAPAAGSQPEETRPSPLENPKLDTPAFASPSPQPTEENQVPPSAESADSPFEPALPQVQAEPPVFQPAPEILDAPPEQSPFQPAPEISSAPLEQSPFQPAPEPFLEPSPFQPVPPEASVFQPAVEPFPGSASFQPAATEATFFQPAAEPAPGPPSFQPAPPEPSPFQPAAEPPPGPSSFQPASPEPSPFQPAAEPPPGPSSFQPAPPEPSPFQPAAEPPPGPSSFQPAAPEPAFFQPAQEPAPGPPSFQTAPATITESPVATPPEVQAAEPNTGAETEQIPDTDRVDELLRQFRERYGRGSV